MTKRKARGKTAPGKTQSPGKFPALLVAAGAMLVALAAAACLAFGKLKSAWNERCIITDHELDVVITGGKMVHPEVFVYSFGLTNGANVAEIPFAEERARLISQFPNIRDLRIERRQPNRVIIEVFEREPVARLATTRGPSDPPRLADTEGMVFNYSGNTAALPLIREPADAPTPRGRKLSGNSLAALRLVELASSPEFSHLRIYEADASRQGFLTLSLADMSRVKIAWDRMDEDSRSARKSLHTQLSRVSQAIGSKVVNRPTSWNATDFANGRIYAKDPSLPQPK